MPYNTLSGAPLNKSLLYKHKEMPFLGFPGGLDGKESACNTGDRVQYLGWEDTPGEGNGDPLQYSCLENPMDGRAWWATDHRITTSRTRLSDFTFTFITISDKRRQNCY